MCLVFFKQKTAYESRISDWSSDVCSSDLTSWMRRVAFMVGALSLSILANGVRAFATIFVAEVTTIDAAAGFDHVVYGWLFFAVIMIVVMAIAWPFFDRQPGDPWFDPEDLRHTGHSATGAVAGVALAKIGRASCRERVCQYV